MHGVVHHTLKAYVAERAGEDGWKAVLDRTGIDPKLYLPVSRYPDEEVATILEAVAATSGNEVTAVERHFGRELATELVGTFRAHLDSDPELFDVLDRLDAIYADLGSRDDELDLPSIECERDGETWRLTYRSHRDHPGMAYGILEGLVREFDATIGPVSALERGSDAYAFDVIPDS